MARTKTKVATPDTAVGCRELADCVLHRGEDLVLRPEPGEQRKMPASASEPITNVQYVYGMYLRSPPMSDMLFECTAWITDPAPRNSSALKKAWVKRWKSPAV